MGSGDGGSGDALAQLQPGSDRGGAAAVAAAAASPGFPGEVGARSGDSVRGGKQGRAAAAAAEAVAAEAVAAEAAAAAAAETAAASPGEVGACARACASASAGVEWFVRPGRR